MANCLNDRIGSTLACAQHEPEWKHNVQEKSHSTLTGICQVLQCTGDHQPWQQNNVNTVVQPHDEDHPEPQQHKHYFSPNHFYCVETICAPCGVVIAWTKFAKSESPTNILNWLASVYPNIESRPDYICIDKACQFLHTAVTNGSWNQWKLSS